MRDDIRRSRSKIKAAIASLPKIALVMIWLFSIDGCTETVGPEQSPTVRASASQSGQQRYIVLFQQETPNPAAVARTIAQANGSEIVHVFEHALKGFSLRNLPPQALDALRRNPNVVSVEPVQILRFSDTQSFAP